MHVLKSFGNDRGPCTIDNAELVHAIEGLTLKHFLHCTSVYQLAKGVDIPALSIKYLDGASINTLTRCAMESFLVFHYNFVSPKSTEECLLRYYAWCIKDLSTKKELEPLTEWGREQHQKMLLELDRFKKLIQQNKHFPEFSDKQKRILLDRGEWPLWDATNGKRLSWEKLAVAAGLNGSNFKHFYSIICGYAHSSYWSMVQLHSITSKDEEKWICLGTISFLEIIMAFMIKSCGIIFPAFEERYSKQPKTVDLIEVLYEIGQKHS